MIGGNIKDFMDGLYYGNEMLTEYKGRRYMIQGWWKNNLFHLEIWDYENPEKYKWSCNFPSQAQCVEEFLNTPHWDGKSFQKIEKDLIWSENWDL